jgi:CDP-paratose 2-epimerase
MKILITGICGFVGNALARLLVETQSGCEITGIDNLSRSGSEINRTALNRLGVDVVHGDLRLAADLENLPAADWVIDAAANPSVLAGRDGKASSRQVMQHNLFGTVNVLEYCRRHGAGLVLLSTSRVYSIAELAALELQVHENAFRPKDTDGAMKGVSAAGVSEEFSTEPPVSLYGATKRCSEVLALEYAHAFDFPLWIDRCGVMAGAGQFGKSDQGIFSFWINSYRSGKPLTYLGFGGSGHQVRDCLHPRDLFALVSRQMESPSAEARKVVNVSGGATNSMSLAQLSAWCSQRFRPREIARKTETRPNDVPWLVLDCQAAETEWDWRPQTKVTDVLEEIAAHSEANPNWLDLSES